MQGPLDQLAAFSRILKARRRIQPDSKGKINLMPELQWFRQAHNLCMNSKT